MQREHAVDVSADEVHKLRRSVRDLVAISALPGLWVGLKPEPVLHSLVQALHQILRCRWVYAVLGENDAATPGEVRTAWGDSGPLPTDELSPSLATAIEQDTHVLADPWGSGLLRILISPLPLEGTFARLVFASDEPDFPNDDERLLINVAVNQGANAIQSARLLAARERAEGALRESSRRIEEQAEILETLRQVGLALTSELDLDALLQHVTEAAAKVTGADFGAFITCDTRAARAFVSDAPEQVAAVRRLSRSKLLDVTLRAGQVVRLDDVSDDPRVLDVLSPTQLLPTLRSYLAYPVVGRTGDVLGALLFCHSSPAAFGGRHEQLVAGIAAHATIAIENARLYEAEHRARTEAEAAVRARDEFLGIASHELRNPLAGLKAAAQLLIRWQSRAAAEDQRGARFLAEINRAADRLTVLVEDLLDVARLRTGQMQVHSRPVDLIELVTERVESHRRLAPQRQILLVAHDERLRVSVDPDRIQQVVDNLLSNGIKYSPVGGPVHVEVSSEGDGPGALLRVSDHGIGLPQGATESIFEPFGRAPNAQVRNVPGMGLGLYICRQIVLSHGGRIWADSPGEGLGSTFSVWLPRGGPVYG